MPKGKLNEYKLNYEPLREDRGKHSNLVTRRPRPVTRTTNSAVTKGYRKAVLMVRLNFLKALKGKKK